MTSPRSSYGGGYYAAPSYTETPIYDMLVAERGTPQIAPIRVSSPIYDTGSSLPALPPAALPPGTGHQQPAAPAYGGYQQPAPAAPQPQMAQPALPQPALPQAPAPLHQAPTAYVPQQAQYPTRGYAAPPMQQQPQPQPQPQMPQQAQPQQMRPVAPRPPVPRQMPAYEDPYGGHQYPGRGY